MLGISVDALVSCTAGGDDIEHSRPFWAWRWGQVACGPMGSTKGPEGPLYPPEQGCGELQGSPDTRGRSVFCF